MIIVFLIDPLKNAGITSFDSPDGVTPATLNLLRKLKNYSYSILVHFFFSGAMPLPTQCKPSQPACRCFGPWLALAKILIKRRFYILEGEVTLLTIFLTTLPRGAYSKNESIWSPRKFISFRTDPISKGDWYIQPKQKITKAVSLWKKRQKNY